MKRFQKKKVAVEWDGGWFCDCCYSFHHWEEEAFVDIDCGDKLCTKCFSKKSKI